VPVTKKIEPKDFYKNLPQIKHETGDIWRGIPSFGLLSDEFIRALVITPACDLEQKKSETVTVLPIITISDFFYSKCFYSEIWSEFSNPLTEFGIGNENRYTNPKSEDIMAYIDYIKDDNKKKIILSKVTKYLEYISYCEDPLNKEKPKISDILNNKNLDKIIKGIITNSYRTDIHYLPHDGNISDSSILDSHSIALFRYSFSFPIDILNLAALGNEDAWITDINNFKKTYQFSEIFKSYPVNVSTLKDDFLSDLISRFISMHIRLGSRDFTEETISNFADTIKENI
jgi:hypothetical protein